MNRILVIAEPNNQAEALYIRELLRWPEGKWALAISSGYASPNTSPDLKETSSSVEFKSKKKCEEASLGSRIGLVTEKEFSKKIAAIAKTEYLSQAENRDPATISLLKAFGSGSEQIKVQVFCAERQKTNKQDGREVPVNLIISSSLLVGLMLAWAFKMIRTAKLSDDERNE